MQVSLETLSGLERRMTVRVPADRLQEEFDGRLRRTARKARVPGFRPGRATLDAVRQRYGAGIRQEVVDEMVQESLQEALRDKQLQPAGRPQVESCNDTVQGLEYVVSFEVWPELKKIDWRGLKVERKNAAVDEEDIERTLQRLRLQSAQWNEVQRGARKEDRVRFDHRIVNDQGEQLMGASDSQALLGRTRLPHDMEEKLLGMQAGESLEYQDVFPDSWPDPALRGQALTVHLEMKGVEEAELPALEQEFFSAFGIEEGGEEELRRQLREQLERAVEDAVQSDLKSQALDALVERHAELPLPGVVVRTEAARLRARMGKPPEHNGADAGEDGDDEAARQALDAPFTAIAERRVRLSLVLMELARALEVKADPERVRAAIEREAASYREPQELVRWYYSNQEALQGVESSVLEEQLVERMLKEAKLSEKTLSCSELLATEGP